MTIPTKCAVHGVIPAIITPMDEKGNLDLKMLENQALYFTKAGVDGLFLCGGTGEGAYLTTEEKREVMRTVKEAVGDSVFLCLAAIRPSTRQTLEEIDALADLNPDFWVSTAPFYHAMSQKDLLAHYETIAKHISAPLIVYNIPSTTHNYIELDTVAKLSQLDQVAAVKDSSGNFINFSRGLLGPRSDKFAWIQGEDYLCAPALLCGGDGMVSGLSNARVEPYVAMYRAYENKDWDMVRDCQAQINKLYAIIHSSGNGNASIEAAAELAGRGRRYMRQQSQTLQGEQLDAVARLMDEYDQAYPGK